jgi:alpha-beta hydrolase superfamily lysophospholipase
MDCGDLVGLGWGPTAGGEAVLALHGLTGHAGWFEALGAELAAGGVAFVAADRRGAGRSSAPRGDVPSAEAMVTDACAWLSWLRARHDAVHLVGWCQGARTALLAAATKPEVLASLALITPSVLPSARAAARAAAARAAGDDTARVPVGITGADLTVDPVLARALDADPLRTLHVTRRMQAALAAERAAVPAAWDRVRGLPRLVVLATDDALVDNEAVVELLGRAWPDAVVRHLPGGHALQLEHPRALAEVWRSFRGSNRQGDAT